MINELPLQRGKDLSGKRDSNPRPSAWEADALPTELFPQFGFGKTNLVKFLIDET